MLIFYVHAKILFFQCQPVPGAYLGQNGTQWDTSNTKKKRPKIAKNSLSKISEPPSKTQNNCSLFSSSDHKVNL